MREVVKITWWGPITKSRNPKEQKHREVRHAIGKGRISAFRAQNQEVRQMKEKIWENISERKHSKEAFEAKELSGAGLGPGSRSNKTDLSFNVYSYSIWKKTAHVYVLCKQ